MVGHAGSPTRTVYLDVILTQGHGAFELPTISEAVNAGGDDRSRLCGAFWFTGRMPFLLPYQ